jgi:hypothetical protein
MEKLIAKLQADYPQFTFIAGRIASWSPKHKRVAYVDITEDASIWAALHELGHALAGHTTYESDVVLIRKETEAWQKALEISPHYDIHIDDEHVQNCLDTYRDWLYKRSTCPACEGHGIQEAHDTYSCYNCTTTWHVSSERFCRPYRVLSAK